MAPAKKRAAAGQPAARATRRGGRGRDEADAEARAPEEAPATRPARTETGPRHRARAERDALFYPFRALGYVTERAPFAVNRRGKETFVTVSAGRAFQIYDCEKMRLKLVGPQLGGEGGPDISALACRDDLTFVGIGSTIVVCRRTHRLCAFRAPRLDDDDDAAIASLFVFGSDLISLDAKGRVRAWDISKAKLGALDGKTRKTRDDASARSRRTKGRDEPRQAGDDSREDESDSDESDSDESASDEETRDEDTNTKIFSKFRSFPAVPTNFHATAICHPATYLNKVLLGSDDGRALLLNVKSGSAIYEFAAFAGAGSGGVAVTCLANAPALDTVAVGLADGSIRVHNVRLDSSVAVFGHDGSRKPVRDVSFSTGRGEPLLAAIGDSGTVSVWDLEKRRLRTLVVGAHDAAGISCYFFPGSPILMTSGGDNALKHWIFDNRDGSGRLLRFRAGHSAPPKHVQFYGEQGTRLLSAGGDDRALRVFSAIQDQQSLELSQSHVERRAKRLKIAETELKLPPVASMAWSETRERDWANVVTCHVGEPRAYTWRLKDGVLGEHVLVPPARVGPDGLVDNKSPVSAVAVSACGNFAVVGVANGDVHRFNLQSGAHRGAFKRDDLKNAETVAQERIALARYRANRARQLNLPGGARSIWNAADRSFGADAFLKNNASRRAAHDGHVAAVIADGSNESLVTCGGNDGVVRVWAFNSQKLRGEICLSSSFSSPRNASPRIKNGENDESLRIVAAKGHAPSGLVAVACGDATVRVVDVAGMRRVRTLRCGGDGGSRNHGITKSFSSLEFSSDGRWVLAASADGAVRVWDVPAARLLQTLRFSAAADRNVVTGMALSPAMDMLATTHEGRRGVYLWANSAMYAPAGKRADRSTADDGKRKTDDVVSDGNVNGDDSDDDSGNASSEEPTVLVRLPTLHAESADAETITLGSALNPVEAAKETEGLSAKQSEDVLTLAPMAQTAAAKAPTPAPVAPGMATMALLPKSQWMGLLHLETIRERNKPIAAVTKPEAAPFFLPTTAGLAGDAVFDLGDDGGGDGGGGGGGGGGEENDDDAAGGRSGANDRSRILTQSASLGGDVEGALLRLIRRGAAAAAAAEDQALADAKKGVLPGRVGKKTKTQTAKRGVQKRLHVAFDAAAAIDGESDYYHEVTKHLRGKGPSALDAEIRALGPWDAARMTDAEADELGDVLDFFAREIPSGRNFELCHALLAHFLRVHGSAIRERESLRMRAETVRAAARRAWGNVDALMQEVRCALGFFGGQHGQ